VSLLTDNNKKTYWATADEITKAELIIDFGKLINFDVVSLQEYIPLGQRIDGFTVEVFENNNWKLVNGGASIGAKRLIRLEKPVTSNQIRIKLKAPVAITLSEIGVYKLAI
jgi:alpha-L-fucosidase